jgi:hypothetical protein
MILPIDKIVFLSKPYIPLDIVPQCGILGSAIGFVVEKSSVDESKSAVI